MEKTREKISTARSLIAGLDYPRTYLEFVKQFPDDDACLHYLKKLRWPKGFICPACNAFDDPWHQTRGRLVCRTCQHQTSITSGTIFDKTRTPLITWFEVAWLMTTTKNGFSAKSFERTMDIRYQTAWAILQRYRIAIWYEAIVNVYRELLKLMKLLWAESSTEESVAVGLVNQL